MSLPLFERPLQPMGRPSQLVQRLTTAAQEHNWERARIRFLVAKTIETLAPDAPMAKKATLVQGMVESGLLPQPLSSGTIRNLSARWRGGSRSIEAFLDRPRRGRGAVQLDARIAETLRTSVLTRRPGSIRRIYAQIAREARELGVSIPSYNTVRQMVAQSGLLAHSAARHGARAAQMDGLPHSTIPAEYTHDVWTVDEFTLPVWCRMYDRAAGTWVSFKPDVVVVQDYASRVILAAWVADPARRFDAKGQQKHSGSDQSDVLAALCSAALPEVASPACREYAGSLPSVSLRWDRARHHESLRPGLKAIGVPTPELPGMRPINRGIVERGIGTFKRRCDEIFGHVDYYVPADRVSAESEAQKTALDSSGNRDCVREVVPPQYLHDVRAIRAAVDGVVRGFNEEHEHSGIGGLTPATAFREFYPSEAPRPGRDILALLKVRTTTVSTAGIVHRVGASAKRFAFEANGIMLTVGRIVTYRADPLLRGLFAELPSGPLFLPPLAEWAARHKPEDVALQQEAAASLAAEQAKIAQREAAAKCVGEAVLAEGDAARATAYFTDTADAPGGDEPGGIGGETAAFDMAVEEQEPALTGSFDSVLNPCDVTPQHDTDDMDAFG